MPKDPFDSQNKTTAIFHLARWQRSQKICLKQLWSFVEANDQRCREKTLKLSAITCELLLNMYLHRRCDVDIKYVNFSKDLVLF